MMRDTFRVGGWVLFIGIVVLVVGIGLAAMSIFGFGLFRRATADFRGQTEAIERIQADPDYRIAVRQRFFNLCASVRAKEEQIANVEMELEQASGDRREQLQGAITALRNSRAELIEDYNAAASDQFTRGVFLDLSLPYQLSTETEETQCAV